MTCTQPCYRSTRNSGYFFWQSTVKLSQKSSTEATSNIASFFLKIYFTSDPHQHPCYHYVTHTYTSLPSELTPIIQEVTYDPSLNFNKIAQDILAWACNHHQNPENARGYFLRWVKSHSHNLQGSDLVSHILWDQFSFTAMSSAKLKVMQIRNSNLLKKSVGRPMGVPKKHLYTEKKVLPAAVILRNSLGGIPDRCTGPKAII